MKEQALLFGASGALGSAILAQLEHQNFEVITAGSSPNDATFIYL